MLRNHVVVDGSNIATEGRSTPSLTQLDEAVRAFLAEHPSEQATVIVDATFGHRIHESEQDAFEEAVNAGELLTAPAGTIGRGDAFILEVADKAGATVLSNDSFQEFHGKYTWLFDEGRLIGGKPVPGVGWVFLLRSPVRGPVSRRAVQEAKGGKASRDARGGRGGRAPKETKKKAAAKKKSGGRTTATTKKKQPRKLPSDLATADAIARAAADDGSGARKRARQPLEPLNEALPFIEFVGAHPVGSVVLGEVEQFSSHGAYVEASGARCYVPLKLMGDPPPKSAKEILHVGDRRDFVVFAIDPPRRGIDLALANARLVHESDENMPADQQEQRNSPTKRARKRNARRDARDLHDATPRVEDADNAMRDALAETTKTPTKGSTLATNTRADQRAEEAPVTPARKKKAAAKRTAKKSAKRAPARRKKAAAKKRPAKKRAVKRTAKKRATKKRAAKRAPARKKKAASKKRAAKKRPAKKRPAKRRATKKRATKKRATKKRATKKRPAKKRATKKRATKKRATKKRATKKRAAKRPAKKRATKRRARR